MMNNKKGFTLTEILLAVMIVGLIGVALAALTTAATRESGVGRSKVMIRNNLSLGLRQLRQDITQSTRIDFVNGAGTFSDNAAPLLKLAKNVDSDGNLVQQQYLVESGNAIAGDRLKAHWIVYCFKRGNITADVVPAGAIRGGRIFRIEAVTDLGSAGTEQYPDCTAGGGSTVLNNVKYIPNDANNYPVPLFTKSEIKVGGTVIKLNANALNSLMMTKIITELNSTPPVNDVIEEVFTVPNGF